MTVREETYDQSFISGNKSGNNNSLNTINYYVPGMVPFITGLWS